MGAKYLTLKKSTVTGVWSVVDIQDDLSTALHGADIMRRNDLDFTIIKVVYAIDMSKDMNKV